MADKNYVSGILIKEVGQYGQLNLSIKVEDFVEQLNGLNNNGWVNLTIAKNRNPTDKGYTHHCFENTWKKDQQKETPKVKEEPIDDGSGLPF